MEIQLQRPVFWLMPVAATLIVLSIVNFMPARLLFGFAEQPFGTIEHLYVDFDTSMRLAEFPATVQDAHNAHVYAEFKKLYEEYSFKKVHPSTDLKIPKIIHIVWLGGKLPAMYEGFVRSWYDKHPDWTILFWTDHEANYDRGTIVSYSFDDLDELLKRGHEKRIAVDTKYLTFGNRFFYDKSPNYGEKSDILKWEIVYRFGGVYVDIDFEAYQPLDVFHYMYDFYTGIQPLDTNIVQLGAALYGARPHHPVMEACVENIRYNQHIPQIVAKTGPLHFTKCFLTYAGKNGQLDVALPASYLYPCSYEERGTDKRGWCKPESYAVHHWAGSWLKPEGFVKRR